MTFLEEPPPSIGQERLRDSDVAERGYVWELTRGDGSPAEGEGTTHGAVRVRGRSSGVNTADKDVNVITQAAANGDPYCAVAWGKRLTDWTDPNSPLTADDAMFNHRELASAVQARTVYSHPGQHRNCIRSKHCRGC